MTMKILIACEHSGVIRDAFKARGHNAWSCDLKPSDTPGQHIEGDVFGVLDEGWDMMIAHPPCTYLAVSGAQWYYHPEDKHLPTHQRRPHPRYPDRVLDREDAIAFFMALYQADIPRVCIENPVGTMSTVFRKPDQIVQPYMFGDPATKTTCLWLRNLPLLEPTEVVDKGERVTFKSGKSHPKWYADALAKAKTKEERQTLRSITFPGMARAMAQQWG